MCFQNATPVHVTGREDDGKPCSGDPLQLLNHEGKVCFVVGKLVVRKVSFEPTRGGTEQRLTADQQSRARATRGCSGNEIIDPRLELGSARLAQQVAASVARGFAVFLAKIALTAGVEEKDGERRDVQNPAAAE